MDIFKKLPFDLQERIYKESIYKQNYNKFVNHFNNLVMNFVHIEFDYELSNEEINLEDAYIEGLNFLQYEIEYFIEGIKHIERNYDYFIGDEIIVKS